MPRESLVRFGVPNPAVAVGQGANGAIISVFIYSTCGKALTFVAVLSPCVGCGWVLRKNRLSSLNIAMMNNWKTKITINLAGWLAGVIILF